MHQQPSHAVLKQKQRALRSGFPETMGLRVHRSISWIGRAETETADPDARFLFLWIAFNSAYADGSDFNAVGTGERSSFADYFNKIVALDSRGTIYDAIWRGFPGPIRLLMQNRYLFNPFWQHHNGIDGYEDWTVRFTASARGFAAAVRSENTAEILEFLFDRLYVLRNQIIHGGSTWNSSVNRQQVRDGAAILGFLLPVFVDIMMDNPDRNWGQPFYPVVS